MKSKFVVCGVIGLLLVAGALRLAAQLSSAPVQPKIEARKASILTVGGLKFRDLNKNGQLDRYEDWRLPVDQRVADLVSRMTLEEKAGMMFNSAGSGFLGPTGEILGAPAGGRGGAAGAAGPGLGRAFQGRPNMNNVEPSDSADPATSVTQRNVRWFYDRASPPVDSAKYHNALQELAEGTRLGIPILFDSDPRHGAGRGGSTGSAPNNSLWPDQLGLAAARDPELVRQFGQIAGQELRAIGIRATLSPMADTATEPRWNRINGTFGEDANLNATLVKAYVEGFQGKQLGPESVMTVTKHFPGDGPVKDGYDPHNYYGKWTIYPGNNFDYHLIPFRASFEAGTGGIMTAYMIPVGKDTVAVAYSKSLTTGLLRDSLGFKGMIMTDFLRNMPWGVETLSEKERKKRMILAGVDQFGGDNDPKNVIANVRDGSVPMSVIDAAVRHVLTPMFQLGLFEDPYVDPDAAGKIVASQKFMDAGYAAQVRSTVLLKNANNLLPFASGKRIYLSGIANEAAARYGTVVNEPRDADIALLRVASPATTFPFGGAFAGGASATGLGAVNAPAASIPSYGIALAYGNAANFTVLDSIKKVASSGKPTVVIVNMDRPVILTEFIDGVAAVFGGFGASDSAVMDIVFGKYAPTGKLPFDLPSDMPSVLAQAADVPFDMADPLFKFGYGLTYNNR